MTTSTPRPPRDIPIWIVNAVKAEGGTASYTLTLSVDGKNTPEGVFSGGWDDTTPWGNQSFYNPPPVPGGHGKEGVPAYYLENVKNRTGILLHTDYNQPNSTNSIGCLIVNPNMMWTINYKNIDVFPSGYTTPATISLTSIDGFDYTDEYAKLDISLAHAVSKDVWIFVAVNNPNDPGKNEFLGNLQNSQDVLLTLSNGSVTSSEDYVRNFVPISNMDKNNPLTINTADQTKNGFWVLMPHGQTEEEIDVKPVFSPYNVSKPTSGTETFTVTNYAILYNARSEPVYYKDGAGSASNDLMTDNKPTETPVSVTIKKNPHESVLSAGVYTGRPVNPSSIWQFGVDPQGASGQAGGPATTHTIEFLNGNKNVVITKVVLEVEDLNGNLRDVPLKQIASQYGANYTEYTFSTADLSNNFTSAQAETEGWMKLTAYANSCTGISVYVDGYSLGGGNAANSAIAPLSLDSGLDLAASAALPPQQTGPANSASSTSDGAGGTLTTTTNSSGLAVYQRDDFADGTHEVTLFGIMGQPFTAIDRSYDASGAVTSATLYAADGSVYATGNSVLNGDGTTTVTYTNADDNIVAQEIDQNVNSLSRNTLTVYGTPGQTWPATVSLYDQSGDLASTKFYDATGALTKTESVQFYGNENIYTYKDTDDVLLEQRVMGLTGEPYSGTDTTYDASGAILTQNRLYSDGSVYEQGVETANADGSTTLTFTRPNETLDEVDVTNADGTRVVSLHGVDDQPYVASVTDYAANGDISTQTLSFADGTTYQTSTLNADDSTTILTYADDGSLVTQEIDGGYYVKDVTQYVTGQPYVSVERAWGLDDTLSLVAYHYADGSETMTGFGATGALTATETVTPNADGSTTTTIVAPGQAAQTDVVYANGSHDDTTYAQPSGPTTQAWEAQQQAAIAQATATVDADRTAYSDDHLQYDQAKLSLADDQWTVNNTEHEQTLFSPTGHEGAYLTVVLATEQQKLADAQSVIAKWAALDDSMQQTLAQDVATLNQIEAEQPPNQPGPPQPASIKQYNADDDLVQTTTFQPDGSKAVTSYGIDDQLYTAVTTGYNASGQVISKTFLDPADDVIGTAAVTVNADGSTTTNTYDADDVLSENETVAVDGTSEIKLYGDIGFAHIISDAQYNAAGQKTSQIEYTQTGQVSGSTTESYDDDGSTLTRTFNAEGVLTTKTAMSANGSSEVWTYDDDTSAFVVTDARYNAADDLLGQTDYGLNGAVAGSTTITTNADGSTSTNIYVGGALTQSTVVAADGSRVSSAYGITDDDYYSTIAVYNAADDIVSETYFENNGAKDIFISGGDNVTFSGVDYQYSVAGALVSQSLVDMNGDDWLTGSATLNSDGSTTIDYTGAAGADDDIVACVETDQTNGTKTFDFTNAAGQLQYFETSNADGSSSIETSAAAGLAYATVTANYNVAGVLTSKDYLTAAGAVAQTETFSIDADDDITDNLYNAAGTLTQSTVTAADGSSVVSEFGVVGQSYVSLVDDYNAAGTLTSSTQTHTDGSSDVVIYGVNDELWTAVDSTYDAAGALTAKTLLKADGSVYLTGVASPSAYGSTISYDDATGAPVATEIAYSSGGGSFTQTFTSPQNTITGSTYNKSTMLFDADDQPYSISYYSSNTEVESDYVNADGSLTAYNYSYNGIYYESESVYSADDTLQSTTFYNDNYSRSIENYGVTNQPYTAILTNYDIYGTISSIERLTADGSVYETGTPVNYQLGANDAAANGSLTFNYDDAAGSLVEIDTIYTNGASLVVDDAPPSGSTYVSSASSYNADDFLMKEVFYNADGSIQDSIANTYDSSGALSSSATLSSNGTPESVVIYATSTTTTETFDATGAIATADVVNSDGSQTITTFGITGQAYNSAQTDDNAAGVVTQITYFNNNGTRDVVTPMDDDAVLAYYASTDYLYDASDDILSVTLRTASGGIYQNTDYAYNADGSQTQTTYNSSGALIGDETIYADGSSVDHAYLIAGEPYVSSISTNDVSGNGVETFYNADGSVYDSETRVITTSDDLVVDMYGATGALVSSVTYDDTGVLIGASAGVSISTYLANQASLDAQDDIVISDSAANVSANFAALDDDYHVVSILFTDPGIATLSLNVAQTLDDTLALSDITNYANYDIAVSDTAANVSTHIDALNDDANVASITLTDSGAPTLSLTAAQAADDTTTLGEITNANYAIDVTDTATNIAAHFDALAANVKLASITLTDAGTPTLTLTVAQALDGVAPLGDIHGAYAIAISDTAANVAAHFDALDGDPKVVSITLTDPGAPILTLTAAQASADATALDEIVNTNYSLIISSAPSTLNVAQALAAQASGLLVADTAANVATNIDALNADANVASITLTDSGTPKLTLSAAQALDDADALGKIANSGYAVAITDSAVDISTKLDAINSDSHVASITLTNEGTPTLTLTTAQAMNDASALAKITNADYVIAISDSSANVAAHLNALTADALVTSITLTDANPMTLTATQALGNVSTLGKITNANYTIAIVDSAANVNAQIDQLDADARVVSIALTDTGVPTITLSVAQTLDDAAMLNKIKNANYEIAVSDTSTSISAEFDALNSDAKIVSIAVVGGNPLTLSIAQIQNDAAALGKIANTAYALVVSDTAANVSEAIDALNDNPHISMIALTDAGTPTLTLTVAQTVNDATALGKITGNYSLAISDTSSNVSAAIDALNSARYASITLTDGKPLLLTVAQALNDAKALEAITNTEYTIVISDTAANVEANLDALRQDANITSITLTDSPIPTLTLTAAQVVNDAATLGKITNANSVVVVVDAAANVAANLDELNAQANLASITLTDAGTPTLILTAAQALHDATALGKLTNSNYAIAISDNTVNIAANFDALNSDPRVTSIALLNPDNLVLTVAQTLSDTIALKKIINGAASPVTVRDTATNISNSFDTLNANASVASIVIIGSGPLTLTLTAAQALGDPTTFARIENPQYQIAVIDDAANISKSIDALNADAKLTSITLTDTGTPTLFLSVAQALGDSAALGKISNVKYVIAVSDTAANIAANFDALNSDAHLLSISINDNKPITLTVAQTLADTVALGKIGNASYSIDISDTAADFVSHIDALNSNIHVTAIALTDVTTPILTLTVAQALADSAALQKITTTAYEIAISDTAANVQANFDALNNLAKLTSIVFTDSVTPILTLTSVQALNDTLAISKITGAYKLVVSSPGIQYLSSSAIASLTASQAATLAAAGTTSLSSTSGTVNLTVSQAVLLASYNLRIVTPAIVPLTINGAITLTASQIAQIKAIGAALSVTDASTALNAITPTNITTLATLGVTTIAVQGAVILTMAQVTVFQIAHIALSGSSDGVMTISDTAAHLQALTGTQIAALGAFGITNLSSNNGAVKLSVVQAIALESAKMAASAAAVSISDTTANIETITAAEIDELPLLGFSSITSINGSVGLTLAQALAFVQIGFKINVPVGAKITISDTAANVAALTASGITGLMSIGVTSISATGANVTLNVAQIEALGAAAIALTTSTGDTVVISDLAANIASLTTAQIAGLATRHVTQMIAKDSGITLSVSQALALAGGKIALSAPIGDFNNILDGSSAIQALTAAQIVSLASTPRIVAIMSSASLALSATQALAFENAHIDLAAPKGSTVSLSDTAARLQALTVTQIAALPGIGITHLVSSNGPVTYTVAQTLAMESAGVSVSATGPITISDTAANIQKLTTSEIQALATLGFSAVISNNWSLQLSLAQATMFSTNGVKIAASFGAKLTIVDTAANIAALTNASIAALAAMKVSAIIATGAGVTLNAGQALALEAGAITLATPIGYTNTVADLAANLQALTTTQISYLYWDLHVKQLTATDAGAMLTVAQALALENTRMSLTVPMGALVRISDAATAIETLTASEIYALSTLGISGAQATSGSLAFSARQAAAMQTVSWSLTNANGSPASFEVVDSGGNLDSLSASQLTGLAAMGAPSLVSTAGGLYFNALQTSAIAAAGISIIAPSGASLEETFIDGATMDYVFNAAGHDTFSTAQSLIGVAVSDNATTISVSTGGEILKGTGSSTETLIASTRVADGFSMTGAYGAVDIENYHASGALADTLTLQASEFSYLTPGMTQAAEATAVLSHASGTSSATITDSHGDSVTFDGVSVAALVAHPSSLSFK